MKLCTKYNSNVCVCKTTLYLLQYNVVIIFEQPEIQFNPMASFAREYGIYAINFELFYYVHVFFEKKDLTLKKKEQVIQGTVKPGLRERVNNPKLCVST